MMMKKKKQIKDDVFVYFIIIKSFFNKNQYYKYINIYIMYFINEKKMIDANRI